MIHTFDHLMAILCIEQRGCPRWFGAMMLIFNREYQNELLHFALCLGGMGIALERIARDDPTLFPTRYYCKSIIHVPLKPWRSHR